MNNCPRNDIAHGLAVCLVDEPSVLAGPGRIPVEADQVLEVHHGCGKVRVMDRGRVRGRVGLGLGQKLMLGLDYPWQRGGGRRCGRRRAYVHR